METKNITFLMNGSRFSMNIARNWFETNPSEITKNIENIRGLVSNYGNICSIDCLMGCVNAVVGNTNNINGSRMCFYKFSGKERVWLSKENGGWYIKYFKNVSDESVVSEFVGKRLTEKVCAAYLWKIIEMASRAIFVPTSVVLCVKENVRVNTFDNFVDAKEFLEEKYNDYEQAYPDGCWWKENGFACRERLDEAWNDYMIKMALTTEVY